VEANAEREVGATMTKVEELVKRLRERSATTSITSAPDAFMASASALQEALHADAEADADLVRRISDALAWIGSWPDEVLVTLDQYSVEAAYEVLRDLRARLAKEKP
jgi:antirestriction protein